MNIVLPSLSVSSLARSQACRLAKPSKAASLPPTRRMPSGFLLVWGVEEMGGRVLVGCSVSPMLYFAVWVAGGTEMLVCFVPVFLLDCDDDDADADAAADADANAGIFAEADADNNADGDTGVDAGADNDDDDCVVVLVQQLSCKGAITLSLFARTRSKSRRVA